MTTVSSVTPDCSFSAWRIKKKHLACMRNVMCHTINIPVMLVIIQSFFLKLNTISVCYVHSREYVFSGVQDIWIWACSWAYAPSTDSLPRPEVSFALALRHRGEPQQQTTPLLPMLTLDPRQWKWRVPKLRLSGPANIISFLWPSKRLSYLAWTYDFG